MQWNFKMYILIYILHTRTRTVHTHNTHKHIKFHSIKWIEIIIAICNAMHKYNSVAVCLQYAFTHMPPCLFVCVCVQFILNVFFSQTRWKCVSCNEPRAILCASTWSSSSSMATFLHTHTHAFKLWGQWIAYRNFQSFYLKSLILISSSASSPSSVGIFAGNTKLIIIVVVRVQFKWAVQLIWVGLTFYRYGCCCPCCLKRSNFLIGAVETFQISDETVMRACVRACTVARKYVKFQCVGLI